ncbi:MAG TPA: hypothetical protein VLB46_05290 [Pyrinomonadaceae bacterium]|nr:hypothetical protein [Pyrinomonadaceae bacterium]
MGTPLRRHEKIVLLIVAIGFIALASYSCQKTEPASTNANLTATASPTPQSFPPWPSGFPQAMPSPVISGNIPRQVVITGNPATPQDARPFFDNFSWESFIALNWPAASGARGMPEDPDNPNVFFTAPNGAAVVWGTYKDSFDLFGQGDKRPTAWNLPSDVSPCPGTAPGQKTLIFTTKGDTALMQTKEAFSFPLIDQRSNFVYFDIRYDEAQYNFIRGDDNNQSTWLYLLKNLAPVENQPFGVQMPMTTTSALGSIMVKAAWRIATSRDDSKRYYAINAQIYNSQTQTCTPSTVLLVGLHIAHKVDPFTEWVWSTFEQVDNVPPDPDVTPKPSPPPNGYSFNNGTGTPPTPNGYNYKPPLTAPGTPTPTPSPVQVTRVNPIPNTPQGQSTRDVNTYYQGLLKGTVWQYYQLVVTQWPASPGIGQGKPFMLMQKGGVYPQNAGAAFPVNGAVNTTMETYFQTQNDAAGAGGNSCMSCHYRAGQSDFSWGLNRRAH